MEPQYCNASRGRCTQNVEKSCTTVALQQVTQWWYSHCLYEIAWNLIRVDYHKLACMHAW